ncbi:MAG: hypothetical protein RR177_00680 [Oscillospiraceae bacterium]
MKHFVASFLSFFILFIAIGFLMFKIPTMNSDTTGSSVAQHTEVISKNSSVLLQYTFGENSRYIAINLMFSENKASVSEVRALSENVGQLGYDRYLSLSEIEVEEIIDILGGIDFSTQSEIFYEDELLLEEGDYQITGEQFVKILKTANSAEMLTARAITSIFNSNRQNSNEVFEYIFENCMTDISYMDVYNLQSFLKGE